jgi:tetratricopeptide (TPR) repeat protein
MFRYAQIAFAFFMMAAVPALAAAGQERVVYREAKGGTALIVAINDRLGSVSFGSGFFVHENGLLLTNAHVIEDHSRLMVYLRNGSIFESPQVVAVDPDLDLAALQIPTAVTPLYLASELPEDGVSAIAVGYPRVTDVLQMGLTLHATVFPVNVSGIAIGRSRIVNRPVSFIQTTGVLNSGSSGGPLVEVESGDLIGMVVQTVPYWGQAKDHKGGVVGNVLLKAAINYSIPAGQIREWLQSHRLPFSHHPSGAVQAAQPARRNGSDPPTADAFFATAHLLHTMAMVMKNDRDLLELSVAHYQTALELQPQASWIFHNLGLAYTTLGRLEDAIEAYQAALVLTPEDTAMLADLGYVLHRARQTHQSITSYQAAIQVEPCFMRAHSELGVIFLENQKWKDAIAAFSRAAQCHPPTAAIGYNWGLALEQEGRSDEALKVWEGFLAKDPSKLPAGDQKIVEKIREKATSLKKSKAPSLAAANLRPAQHTAPLVKTQTQ